MNELKYVIVLPGAFSEDKNQARAVIFNGLLNHKSIGESAAESCNGKILSAGFMDLNSSGGVKCYGGSESLKIESIPSFDEEIIMNTLLKMHPYL